MKTITAEAAKTTDDYDAACVGEGFLFATVCHRVGVDSHAAINAVCFPAGTSGGWQLCARDELPESWWEGTGAKAASPTDDPHDAPYPQPCGHHPETHVHVVAAC